MQVILRWAACLVVFTGLCACGGPSSAPSVPEPAGDAVLQDLPGNYSMKVTSAGEVHYSTAIIRHVVATQYQIARITVYGPVMYGFTLKPDATVVSEELGKGMVTWQEAIQKLTIRFEREDFVCELSR